jgi:hypothetical protein
MKTKPHTGFPATLWLSWLPFLLLAPTGLCYPVQDMNHDGNVDILWRHKSSGDNSVWIMIGTNYSYSVPLPWV